ncbi:hypothetical protein FACS1894111_06020 [Clostridia bacterium]|nr:hypothetical protein FACS1894111_06020 [Clostridia bacterium]
MRVNKVHIATVIVSIIIGLLITNHAMAAGKGYQKIEQTENAKVIELTNRVAKIYPVAPELIQAIIFYESSNRMEVKSSIGCVGYMQLYPKYQKARADKLGVSIYDTWGNILTGTDYLIELCEKYEDVAVALAYYNGDSKAGRDGYISNFAENILNLSRLLEEKHYGK